MNKNIIKLFAILMMCFLIGSVLVACGNTNAGQEIIVQDGKPGEAATIDIVDGFWVINGNKTNVKAEGKDGADADSIRCVEHHWDPVYVEITKHTVDTIGLYLKVCVDCDGAEIIRYNHVYDQKGEVVPATCTTDGYTKYECICGKVDPDADTLKKDKVAALDHKAGEKEYIEFNSNEHCECQWNHPWVKWCLNEGCEFNVNTVNGKPLEEGNDGIKPHEYTEWAPADQGSIPDCDWINGTMHRVCVKCEASAVCNCEDKEQTDTKGGVANGHPENQEFTDFVIDEANGKLVASFKCKECGVTITENLDLAKYTTKVDATCAKDGSITVKYGEKVISTKVLHKEDVEHTKVAVGVAQDKTCTQDGTTAGQKCSVCGKVFEEQKVDAALGHNNGEGIDADTGRKHSVVTVNGVEYDAYWCEVCKHWVAYQKHEG